MSDRRIVLAVSVLAASVAIATPVRAQSDQQSALAPQCPAGAAPVLDTATVTIGLWPAERWRNRRYNEAQQLRMTRHIDAIRQHFTPPPTLGDLQRLGESRARASGDDGRRAALSGAIVLTLTPAGRLITSEWQQPPMSASLAAAVMRAVMLADSSGSFTGIARDSAAGDTLALVLDSRRDPNPRGAGPLLRTIVHSYVVESPPATQTIVPPVYPKDALRSEMEGRTSVSVIVGSGGRAYMPSFRVRQSDVLAFVAPIRDTMAGAVFSPAVSGGCRVPQMVGQQFVFKLESE